jgi:hypothetical protein
VLWLDRDPHARTTRTSPNCADTMLDA